MHKKSDNAPNREHNEHPAILNHKTKLFRTDWECPFKDTPNCDDPNCNGITEKRCDKWLMSSARWPYGV